MKTVKQDVALRGLGGSEAESKVVENQEDDFAPVPQHAGPSGQSVNPASAGTKHKVQQPDRKNFDQNGRSYWDFTALEKKVHKSDGLQNRWV